MGRRFAPLRTRDGAVAALAVAAGVVPILVAGVRAVLDRWVPIGDNAVLLVRARDVLTANHPWLGTWTSASGGTGQDMNNPGPLFWDVLALPAKLFDGRGMVVGVVALNVAAVVGMAVASRRIAGLLGLTVTMAVASGIGWTMGSELLVDPWQPNALLLPFGCFVVLIWGVSLGHWRMLPWSVAVGSLLLQTHLSYAYLVPTLSLFGLVSATVRRRRGTEADVDRPLAPGRALLWSALVFVVLWAQTFYEQWFGEGEGNLSRLLDASSAEADRIGWSKAFRYLAEVVASPPWWGRRSITEAVTPRPMELGAALVGLGIVVAVLVVCGIVAARAGDRVALAALSTCGLGLVVALGTIAYIPIDPAVGISSHQMRWMWFLSAFWMGSVALTLLRRLPASRAAWAPVATGAVALVFGVANLPYANIPAGPNADKSASPQIAGLRLELGDHDLQGPVLLDLSGVRYGDPFGMPIMAALQEQGVDFVVDDPGWVRQVGENRRFDGEATQRLFIVTGPEALEDQPGATRLAELLGLSPPEQAEMEALADELSQAVLANGLVLTEEGEWAREHDTLEVGRSLLEDRERSSGFVKFGFLIRAMVNGYVTSPGVPQSEFERLGELQRRWNLNTVAVFSEPLE